MLKKALTYCLQDDEPVKICELIGVREYQKQPKLTDTAFVTTSDLKKMIATQKQEYRAQSLNQFSKLKPVKIYINRTFDCKIPLHELTRGRTFRNTHREPLKPKLYFGFKHQQFKVCILYKRQKSTYRVIILKTCSD